MTSPDDDVARYAELAVALAVAEDRDAVLEEHGLDEEAFTRLEDRWLAELSKAEDEAGDGVPPLLQRFAEAVSAAQLRHASDDVMPLERYALITRAISRGHEVAQVLERHGLSLADYLRSHQHWTMKMIGEPSLAARFTRLMQGR
ncbi:MAG: hypothetical protein RIF41_02500 [Polyangiaceae bacterium]